MTADARGRAGGDTLALGALLLLGLIWSLSLPSAKLAAMSAIPVLGYLAWVTTGGTLLLALVCKAKGLTLALDRHSLLYYLLAGLFGHAGPQLNIFIATSHAPVSAVSIVITSTPILTYLFALLLGLERLRPMRIVGVLCGIAGALFILLPKTALPDPSVAFWLFVAFGTPLCYALSNVALVRFKPASIHPLTSAMGMMGTAALALWPAAALWGEIYLPNFKALTPGDYAMAVQTILAGLGYILFFFIIHRAGPVFLTMVSFIVLTLASLWGVLFFDERPTIWFAAAGVCVVAGVILIQRTSVSAAARQPG